MKRRGDAEWERAADRGGVIANRIIAIGAHTMEGLQAKAIAVAYCQLGEDGEIELNYQQTTDVRLAQSILADLLGQWEE